MLKPDMRMIWANSGDVVTPPESKIDLGWILEKPPSQYFNWHLNRTDRMLNHINRRGIPSWSSDTEYHTDGIASYVVGSNGRVYVSVAPSGNNTSPAKDPTTDITREFWKPAFVGWDEAIPESQITGLTAKLNSKVDKTQRVNTSNGLSGGGALSGDLTIRPTYGTTANTVTQGNDPRLSNSREWSAATVGEAEAKAGTATTRRAWTAQRVHQAADGWYDKKFSTIVKNILSRSNAQQIRNDLQLGTAATRDVGTESGNLMEVGARNWGRMTTPSVGLDFNDFSNSTLYPVSGASYLYSTQNENGPNSAGTHVFTMKLSNDYQAQLGIQHSGQTYVRAVSGGTLGNWTEVIRTTSLLSGTGNSTSYPMTQAATTAALNQKVSNTTSIIAGTGLEGGGTLSQNRTLSVKYGNTAGTAVEGNDSRVVNALQKGNNLSDVPNKTLARQYLGLGSASTRNVGTESGNLMEVGAFGLGRYNQATSYVPNITHLTEEEFKELGNGFYTSVNYDPNTHPLAPYDTKNLLTDYLSIIKTKRDHNGGFSLLGGGTGRLLFLPQYSGGQLHPIQEILHTGNILSSTGNSSQYPMTQAAVTSALNTKADTSYVDTELDKKVNNSSVSVALAPNTIPQRDASGRVEVAPPTADGHATNRAYVTTQLGNVESSVTNKMLGVGQTWQDVKSSRSVNTTYTNTTGRPIVVTVSYSRRTGANTAKFTLDGMQFDIIYFGESHNTGGGMTFVVQDGGKYSINIMPTVWAELR